MTIAERTGESGNEVDTVLISYIIFRVDCDQLTNILKSLEHPTKKYKEMYNS